MIESHNNQYHRNEEKIIQGYLAEMERARFGGYISLTTIAEAANMPLQTVVGHYASLSDLECGNIEEIVRIVRRLSENSRIAEDSCRVFLKKLLLTVSRESTRFRIEHYRRNFWAWERILFDSRDILTQGWESYGTETDDIIFHRFCFEFIGTIFLWGKSAFSIDKLGTQLTTLIYLVEHAAKREIIL